MEEEPDNDDFVATADGVRFGPGGEWTAHMAWRAGDHSGPSRLIVEPTNADHYPAGGISQTALRELKFGPVIELVRNGRERVAEISEGQPDHPVDWEATGQRLIELSADGISDSYLAALSWAYASAAIRPKPLERLAEITGKSLAAIKSHLWQATRLGLLYRSPGRAGGAVTEKALRILNADADAEAETTPVEVVMPPRVVEDKPKRRRPQKAITPRTET